MFLYLRTVSVLLLGDACLQGLSLCLNDIVEEECDDGWTAVCRTNFNDSVQLLAKSLKLSVQVCRV